MAPSKRRSREAPFTMQLPALSSSSQEADLTVEERHGTQRVLDLALGIGAVLLASGVGAADVTASMRAVLQAYATPRCQIDVTYDRITVSYRARVGADPLTSMHQVPARSLDYGRLQGVDRLVHRISSGDLERRDAHAELNRLARAPRRYPRWVSTVALAVMAAGLAVLLGGGAPVALIAAAVTAGIDRLGRMLNQRGVLLFLQQIVGAALATAVALLLTAFDVVPVSDPSLIVAASIVVLLSGISVVGAVQDTLTGYYLTGVARAVQIALLSVALLVGVSVALRIGLAFGIDASVHPTMVQAGLLSVPARMLAGGVAAGAAALSSYAPPRGVVAAGVAGAGGSVVLLMLSYAHFDLITSSFLGATLIGLAGRSLSRRFRLPPLVIVMAGILPLVPGMRTYQGFVSLATDDTVNGISALMSALATALALGAGVLCGQILSDPVKRRLSRIERQYLVPAMAGIRHQRRERGRRPPRGPSRHRGA